MKVFIFHIGTPTPVFETELELIRAHELLGDQVRVFQCTGNLTNCHWNPLHLDSKCRVCRSKFKNGWNVLNPGKNVELNIFPVNTLDSIKFPLKYNSVDEIKEFQFDNEHIGYGVVSDITSKLREHRFDTIKYFKEINLGLRTSVQVYVSLKKEFIENRPDRVYFFNGRIATHLPAKLLCKKMGIEFFAYEIGVQDETYRATKNTATHDSYSLNQIEIARSHWTPQAKEIGENFFNQMRHGNNVVNFISYVKNQQKGSLPIGFNSAKINVAIFNSSLDEYSGIKEWENKIYEPDETNGIRQILASFIEDSQYMFYLRVHPNLSTVPSNSSQLSDICAISKEYKNVHVIWPAEAIDSYALIDACNKVLTFGSTMGLEATYWGKPSILAGRAFYENFDCVYKPNNHEEVVNLLKMHIEPLSKDEALLFPYVYIESAKNEMSLKYKWFVKTGIKKGLPAGTFDGIEIKSDFIPALWYLMCLFLSRLKKVVMKPSLLKRFIN